MAKLKRLALAAAFFRACRRLMISLTDTGAAWTMSRLEVLHVDFMAFSLVKVTVGFSVVSVGVCVCAASDIRLYSGTPRSPEVHLDDDTSTVHVGLNM